jgi:hypothetical protein
VRQRTGRKLLALTAGLAISLASGCAIGDEPPGNPSAESIEERPALIQESRGDDPETLATETLSRYLSVAAEDLTLISLMAVEWRDSSLGCPQPGMNYIQVITPGYKAVFLYDGHTYHVHIANGRALVCENPSDGHIGYEIPSQSE